MSLNSEELLQQFKIMVRQLDPYNVMFQVLKVTLSNKADYFDTLQQRVIDRKRRAIDPNAFTRHRTLSLRLKGAISNGDIAAVWNEWRSISPSDQPYIADEVRRRVECDFID